MSKRFRLRHEGRHDNLREVVSHAFTTLFSRKQRTDPQSRRPMAYSEEFWALKGVSFAVKRGEVLGIIGRNGAGKSTLLKILSRITRPTEGSVETTGRIGSLLEVGTGFHPELTGRENVYLNGSILGMRRADISRKFDEIVAFSEVEKFLDTPVKRYSSGMYMRLAFAVAAHLESEILIVDEVLAVGDAHFQKKCLGKMSEVARGGRTILFVSHQMAAVSSLCNRILALKDGVVWALGGSEIIASYLNSLFSPSGDLVPQRSSNELLAKKIWLTRVQCLDESGNELSVAISGQVLSIRLHYDTKGPMALPHFAFSICNARGLPLAYFDTAYSGGPSRTAALGSGSVTCTIPRLPLAAGIYTINALLHDEGVSKDHVVAAARLIVESSDYYGTAKVPPPDYAPILVDHRWAPVP